MIPTFTPEEIREMAAHYQESADVFGAAPDSRHRTLAAMLRFAADQLARREDASRKLVAIQAKGREVVETFDLYFDAEPPYLLIEELRVLAFADLLPAPKKPDGRWVTYEDYARLAADRDTLRRELEELKGTQKG